MQCNALQHNNNSAHMIKLDTQQALSSKIMLSAIKED